VIITSQQEHGNSLHGQGQLGSTATTRSVKPHSKIVIFVTECHAI
jgi:hypothetical protein